MKKVSFSTKLFYGSGSFGYGSMSNTLGNFIMFFGTSIMGISGSLVGIAVAISSLWDGVSDPLIGYLSDNCKSKVFGKRLGFMLFGIFSIALVNILLWSMPSSFNQWGKFSWLLIMLLLLETCNTFFGTPYSALGIDIAPDYNEQSRIQGFKTIFSIMGMIMPSVLMYFFMPSISITIQTQYSQQGYINIAYINSTLVLVFGLFAIFGSIKHVRKYNIGNVEHQKFNIGTLLSGYYEILKKKDFRSVILGYSFATIASAFLTAVGMHLFTYCYHFSSAQISVVLIALFVGAICSQPFWVYLSNRMDKKRALIISLSTIVFGIFLTFLTFLFRSYIPCEIMFYIAIPCILFCGVGAGAMYSLPFSMYADVVTMEMFKTGKNNAGSYTGFFTFTYNIANSIALLIIGFLLDIIKFDSTQPIQAQSVQNGLGLIVFFGCTVFLALSILVFSKYSIKRADVLKVQLILNKEKRIL